MIVFGFIFLQPAFDDPRQPRHLLRSDLERSALVHWQGKPNRIAAAEDCQEGGIACLTPSIISVGKLGV